MKKADIEVGAVYLARVSGTLQRVRITRKIETTARTYSSYCGGPDQFRNVTRWEAKNLATGRAIIIKSAQRLRRIPAMVAS